MLSKKIRSVVCDSCLAGRRAQTTILKKKMHEIQRFLSTPNPDPEQGIALLEKYGRKPFLPRTLRRIVAKYPARVMTTLRYELGQVSTGQRAQGIEHRPEGRGQRAEGTEQGEKREVERAESNRSEVLNDAEKYQRWKDEVTKEINRRMKALYDEGQMLKWTKLEAHIPKEERKAAAFRILEIYKRLLPPLYQDRDRYVHENIKPKWMMKPKPAADLSGLPPVGEMMKAIKNLPTYISKYKDNPKRAEDVEKWKQQLHRYREALGMD